MIYVEIDKKSENPGISIDGSTKNLRIEILYAIGQIYASLIDKNQKKQAEEFMKAIRRATNDPKFIEMTITNLCEGGNS